MRETSLTPRLNILTLLLVAGLAACGTEPEDLPGGDAADSDTGATTGDVDASTGDTAADTDVERDVPDAAPDAGGCGPRPEVACLSEGCAEAEECVFDAGSCFPSVCTCTDAGWACVSDDCVPGYVCRADDGCDGPDPSIDCLDTGCADGRACVPSPIDACKPSSCFCDATTGTWGCTEDCGQYYTCEDDHACGPNPAETCRDLGCPDGQSCALVDPEACVPSSCMCDRATGTWACTDDCEQGFACVDDTSACPSDPDISGPCAIPGQECAWGTECCCGSCSPSLVCTCTGDGWACYATDACMIPSCAGRACDSDSDCEGGFEPLVCVDGVCGAAPRSGCTDFAERVICESVSSVRCEWLEPPGCIDESAPALESAGCYPAVRCATDAECPSDSVCALDLQVAPRCMWEDPLCDACQEVRGVCVPRAR